VFRASGPSAPPYWRLTSLTIAHAYSKFIISIDGESGQLSDLEGSFIGFFDEKYIRNIGTLVGGFLLSKSRLFEFDKAIVDEKKSMGLEETDPIKWKMDDPKCSLSLTKIGAENVPLLKKRIIFVANKVPIKVLMSFVWMGSTDNTIQSWKWSFDNILQRLSIILKNKRSELAALANYPFMDVVFDMIPGRGPSTFYFDVYRDAYVCGYPNLPKNPLPPLRRFKACPCLVTASCLHSLALQLTDFLVGATGEFIEYCHGRRNAQDVGDHFCSFFPHLHKNEKDEVIGCGLIVKKGYQPVIRAKLKDLGLI